jgi:glycosyltransferase involved in cell wall biosynthesis
MDVNSSGEPHPMKVSILLVTYQHEAYIAECLDSVLGQRIDFAMEVLVGEDGSRDRTKEICDRYASRDARITVHQWGNAPKWKIEGHATGRRNFMELLARARGEYLVLLDGDDGWLDRDKLQKQVDLMEKDRTCMGSYHHTLIKDEEGKLLHRWRDELPERMGLEGTVADRAPFHTSSFIWRNTAESRRMITNKAGWKAGSGDMYFFACVSSLGPLRKVDGDLSFYRRNLHGLSSKGVFGRTNIHRLRIMQWQRLLRAIRGREMAHINRVCDDHLQRVPGMPMDLLDKWRWVKAVILFPGFFLRKVERWRAVLRAILIAPKAV